MAVRAPKDTSRHGNFDADLLVKLLEAHITNQKRSQTRSERWRFETKAPPAQKEVGEFPTYDGEPLISRLSLSIAGKDARRALSTVSTAPESRLQSVLPRGRSRNHSRSSRRHSCSISRSQCSDLPNAGPRPVQFIGVAGTYGRPRTENKAVALVIDTEKANREASLRPPPNPALKSPASPISPYVPQSAASAFTRTATPEAYDRIHGTKAFSMHSPRSLGLSSHVEQARSTYVPQNAAQAFATTSTSRESARNNILKESSMNDEPVPVSCSHKEANCASEPSQALLKPPENTYGGSDPTDLVTQSGFLDSVSLGHQHHFALQRNPTKKIRIVDGPIYGVPKTAKWVQDDEERASPRAKDDQGFSSKSRLRRKLSTLRLMAPKSRGADSDVVTCARPPTSKSKVISMFR